MEILGTKSGIFEILKYKSGESLQPNYSQFFGVPTWGITLILRFNPNLHWDIS